MKDTKAKVFNQTLKGNVIKLEGKQQFMEKEIPVIVGGFGEDSKVVTDKTVAEIHNTTAREIRKSINRNIRRFRENIDIIDLKSGGNEVTTFGYSKQEVVQAEHIYLLSEKGYSKLIKIMDTDLAWEIHDKLMDEYFDLRQTIKQPLMSMEDMMIYQLEESKKMKQQLNQINNNALEAVGIAERVEDALNKQMTINTTQQAQLKYKVGKRVRNRLDRCKEFDVKFDASTHIQKFYSNLWNDLKRRFGVARYGDILHIDFDDAMKFVDAWVEPADIRE